VVEQERVHGMCSVSSPRYDNVVVVEQQSVVRIRETPDSFAIIMLYADS
jgi:hypothetical protein